MRVNAYVLAADPSWIEASVMSYYSLCNKIIVSFDKDGLGWTGAKIDSEECVRRLKAIDSDKKMEFCGGSYSRAEYFKHPMHNETYQRQCALDVASEDADWILQLDADEIVVDPDTFMHSLGSANQSTALGMNYPSVWLYSHIAGRWFLAWCRRGYRRSVGYPGPFAVRRNAKLDCARRISGQVFHVDVTNKSTARDRALDMCAEKVIAWTSVVLHLSMLRSETAIRAKFSSFGHAHDHDWNSELKRWEMARKHPLLTSLYTQYDPGNPRRALMPYACPKKLLRLLEYSKTDVAQILRK